MFLRVASLCLGFNGNGGVVISGRGDDNVGDEWHVYAGALTRVEGDSVIIGVGDHVKIASQGEHFFVLNLQKILFLELIGLRCCDIFLLFSRWGR